MNGFYGLPSGKVEHDESFVQCAIREAKEEVGVKLSESQLTQVHTMHRKAETYWVDVYFEASGYKDEPYNAEPHMHSELEWLNISDLPKNTIPAVAEALKNISAGKIYSEFGWE